MKEITAEDIMHIGFLKKSCFTGSSEGMRYRLEKSASGEDGEERSGLLATVWPEPYAFEHTEESRKKRERFSFSEEGLERARQWLNEQKAGYFDSAGPGEEAEC